MTSASKVPFATPLHKSAPHESARLHTTGEARYVDDFPSLHGTLRGHVLPSPHAHAKILRRDATQARLIPGVEAIFFASDIPGENQIGAVIHDEPLLAIDEVHCEGQAVAFIVADGAATCRAAAAAIVVEYEVLPAVLTLRAAIEAESFLSPKHTIQRGDVDAALEGAALRLSGEVESGGQDHFYLETHAVLVTPKEHGTFHIISSSQHPSEVQAKVAEVLGIGCHKIVVEVPRMGGGFGGKETQGAHFASFAAMGAAKTKRPVRVCLNRDQDMIQTGKRHPFFSRYEAGFDGAGMLIALKVETFSDGGWANDLSRAILDRCLFHLDGSYYIPNLHFCGRVARTNTVSNTAFRGFGGPQGVLVTELAINRAAEKRGEDPAALRQRNFYGEGPRDRMPYGQQLTHCRLERIYEELMSSSDYKARRAGVEAFNADSRWVKRGIGFQSVKFGISFTASFLNQAGALVLVYADGSVQLNHGGTEMGQGLHSKMLAVCAHELGASLDRIQIMTTATDKVPNTSATAASSGSDLNGQAVKNACDQIRERLRPVAAELLGLSAEDAKQIIFADGRVFHAEDPSKTRAFAEVTGAAYMQQISLAASGFYRTPGISYDAATGRGTPFHYFAYGGAVVEVEVNGLTGEHRMLRADVLHDVGNALIPSIDRGQVEGAFVQGVGWLTCEELLWSDAGQLRTHSPDTYKIPAIGDVPEDFRVALLQHAPQPGVIHGSKAVGEPPFVLGIAVVTALQHALKGFSATEKEIHLSIPCTPEAILRAVEDARQTT